MKKLFLPLVLLVTAASYAEELVSVQEQFRDSIFQQLPRVAEKYAALSEEQQVQFNDLCDQLVGLNQRAVELLAPAYASVLGQLVTLGIDDLSMTLSFGPQPQAVEEVNS